MNQTAARYDGTVSMVNQNPQMSGTEPSTLSVAAPILPDRFSGVSTPGASPIPPELRSVSTPR